MEYKCIKYQTNSPTSDSFATEVENILNKQLEKSWRLKQIVQVRANVFLIVVEK